MLSYLLNKKIVFEKGADASTSIGSPVLNYQEYVTVWSNVYVRSGNVDFGENERLVYSIEFTIRYNTKTKEINNKYRIKYNGEYYRIIEVFETEPKQTIKIIAERWENE